MQPFQVGTGVVTQTELDQLYDALQLEMLEEDFTGILYMLTAWGKKGAVTYPYVECESLQVGEKYLGTGTCILLEKLISQTFFQTKRSFSPTGLQSGIVWINKKK